MTDQLLSTLRRGVAIPAMPLALTSARKLDERRQRALARYYIAAGAGGIAAGVHTTQFQIRDPRIGLFKPVLQITAEEFTRAQRRNEDRGWKREDGASASSPSSIVYLPSSLPSPLIRIGGICGDTRQATN